MRGITPTRPVRPIRVESHQHVRPFDEAARRALYFARAYTSVRRGPPIDADDLLQGILSVALDDVSRYAPDPNAVAALVAPTLRRREG